MKVVIFAFLASFTMNFHAQEQLIRIQESNYFTSGNNVYYVLSNKFNNSGFFSEIMKGIDTFKIVTVDDEKTFNNTAILVSKATFLEKFNSNSLFSQKSTLAIPLKNVDLKHFKVFGKNYGVFKTAVFHEFNTIENADATSFKVVLDGYNALSKDNKSVYFKEKIITGANPKTFQALKEDYTKDDKAVFKQDKLIKKANPNSFQVLSYTYQIDENQVWIMGQLSKIDAKSFKLLTYTYPNVNSEKIISHYAIDKKKVYFQGEIIPKAHPNTFKLLVSGAPYQIYGIDKNAVFYTGKLLENADAKSFQIITHKTAEQNYDAQDKNYFYKMDKKISRL